MPIYEYECAKCGHRFERMQKVSDPPPRSCPVCKGRKVQKLISAPAIQFKGEGWYVTDYSDKGKAAKKKARSESSTSSSSSESKSTSDAGKDKKPAAKKASSD